MPELPEVETVKNTLKKSLINKKIVDVDIYYNLIEYPKMDVFKKQVLNQTINDIKRRGKWLMFILDDYVLLSHLRMEGKYFIRDNGIVNKHEHICFNLNDCYLVYKDTRKFGRMYLYKKDEVYNNKPLCLLGKEPWDNDLDVLYLKNIFKNKKLPIKTVLLDQSIIVGIGNIYVDEILFLSHINPFRKCFELNEDELSLIIENTRLILTKAIEKGGTTIRSYTSSEGVHGRFQQDLLVHTKDVCPICKSKIIKTRIGGRGTYYCSNCQK